MLESKNFFGFLFTPALFLVQKSRYTSISQKYQLTEKRPFFARGLDYSHPSLPQGGRRGAPPAKVVLHLLLDNHLHRLHAFCLLPHLVHKVVGILILIEVLLGVGDTKITLQLWWFWHSSLNLAATQWATGWPAPREGRGEWSLMAQLLAI